MVNNRTLGCQTEKMAADYLVEKGYKILATNFRCKLGEIDIIATDKDYIAFIEVKYRKTDKNGLPREAVNIFKQRTIIKVAKYYLMRYNLYGGNCRFDVVEMKGSLENIEIHLLQNAFCLA
jgi:putative endonuclease